MNENQICTVAEAAEEANTSKRTILRRIRDGTLNAEKKGGVWIIRRSSLDEYLELNGVPA